MHLQELLIYIFGHIINKDAILWDHQPKGVRKEQ